MEFLMMDWLTKPVWMWLAFIGIVIALLTLDLGVLHRKQREIEVKESLILSAVYIGLGVAFGGWVWWYMGETAGMNYLTGFVIEKSLAMDNVFVIAMIFSYFAVPRLYQHRVLFWGILGCHRAARDHDRAWHDHRLAIRLGAVCLCRFPDLYRHQDVDDGRKGI